MTLRPCLVCGEPGNGPRCAEHASPTPAKPRDRRHVHWNGTRWKKLSARVRKLMPWCADCRRTSQLTTDHVIPVEHRPDLAYEIENLITRCRPCNGRKGSTMPDPTTVAEIEAKIAARKRRTETRGDDPFVGRSPSSPQTNFSTHISGGSDRTHHGEPSRRRQVGDVPVVRHDSQDTARAVDGAGSLVFRGVHPRVTEAANDSKSSTIESHVRECHRVSLA